MLKVLKLDASAVAPTVSHPGEDLGYDLYALEPVVLEPGKITKVRTGVALYFDPVRENKEDTLEFGLLLRDRSSMASKGIMISGGVVDAGYRGEVLVLLTNIAFEEDGQRASYGIRAGDKIAQAIPYPVLTEEGVNVVDELPEAKRGEKGFGSTGQ